MTSCQGTCRGMGNANQTQAALTDNDECVVDVNTSKAVSCLAVVGSGVIRLHRFDFQAHAEDTEANVAAVDGASVFGPPGEGWWVSNHRTR